MKIFNETTGRFMDAGSDEAYDYEMHQPDEGEDVDESVSEVGHVNPPKLLTCERLRAHLNAYFSDTGKGAKLRPLPWKKQINADIAAYRAEKNASHVNHI